MSEERKYVVVKWLDACSFSDWSSMEEIEKFHLRQIETVGVLISQDHEITKLWSRIGLADEISNQDDYSFVSIIPTALIVSMIELEEKP